MRFALVIGTRYDFQEFGLRLGNVEKWEGAITKWEGAITMGMLLDRWKKSKNDFTRITGEKKPKPKGFVDKAFNHTGLTGALKSGDQAIVLMKSASSSGKKVPQAIKIGKKASAHLDKSVAAYLKILEKAAVAEKSAQKTVYYKGLKFLKAELKAIDAIMDQQVDQLEVATAGGSGLDQAFKLVYKGLVASCGDAVAAIKKVKADPTPDTYNSVFRVSNTPGRKIIVQLVAAAKANKLGRLPDVAPDPAVVAKQLAPWNANNSKMSAADPNWTKQDVLKAAEEFNKWVKFAVHYSVAINQARR